MTCKWIWNSIGDREENQKIYIWLIYFTAPLDKGNGSHSNSVGHNPCSTPSHLWDVLEQSLQARLSHPTLVNGLTLLFWMNRWKFPKTLENLVKSLSMSECCQTQGSRVQPISTKMQPKICQIKYFHFFNIFLYKIYGDSLLIPTEIFYIFNFPSLLIVYLRHAGDCMKDVHVWGLTTKNRKTLNAPKWKTLGLPVPNQSKNSVWRLVKAPKAGALIMPKQSLCCDWKIPNTSVHIVSIAMCSMSAVLHFVYHWWQTVSTPHGSCQVCTWHQRSHRYRCSQTLRWWKVDWEAFHQGRRCIPVRWNWQ